MKILSFTGDLAKWNQLDGLREEEVILVKLMLNFRLRE